MAITIDQADIGGASAAATSTSIAFNTTTTVSAGGDIFLLIKSRNDVTVTTIAGGSLSWTQDASSFSSPDLIVLARARAAAGLASGTTITVTFSDTTPNRIVEGCSFVGLSTASPEDSGGSFADATASFTSVAMDPVSSNSLILTAVTLDTDQGLIPDAPSLEAFDKGASFDYRLSMLYRIESSTGTYTNGGTYGASGFILHASAAYGGPFTNSADDPPIGFLGRGAGW